MPERFFADVILPLAIPNLLTYEVPSLMNGEVQAGKRVIVQLGKQKFYSGIVRRVHQNVPPFHDIKEIQQVLDEHPIVNEKQFELWEWIASYYLCHLGEVMNSALPAALKLHTETSIVINPDFKSNPDMLPEKEFVIFEALLVRHQLTLNDAAKIIQRKSAHALVKTMIDKGIVQVVEEMQEKYRAKKEIRISLAEKYETDIDMQPLFEELERRSPKQLEALMVFLKLIYEKAGRKYILRNELMKHESVSSPAINALIKKGVLIETVVFTDRLPKDAFDIEEPFQLSEIQLKALADVKQQFTEHDVVLLHGVTSSGKTEIYNHLIQETVKQGKQVLYLLPEIALTTQMINRLRKHFGNGVGVYHSRQNSNERVDVWNSIIKPPRPPKGGVPDAQAPAKYSYETADPILYGLLKEFVKKHRSVPTEAENVFWQLARNKNLEGYKFRRQHIIGTFIADFVCLEKKLIVEIDGLIHQLPDNKLSDEERTQWLTEKGFHVIRFTNNEVIGNTSAILEKVITELESSTHNLEKELDLSAGQLPPLGGGGAVILGARSALFLPYTNLGLIIVDEEHDPSYKQNEPAPRYHARDSALVLARMFKAKTLLGSATPSLESYFNVKEKKYGIVTLNERFGNMEMPAIVVSDAHEATRKKLMKSHFTPAMIDAIGNALINKEQVILFQNRRGFAPVLECNNCNWIPQCKNCSVTLTYHKQVNQLKCHYCGYSQHPPSTCQRCGDHHLEIKGFGTEKIEEEISIFFPQATIARLDLDSTRTKNSFQKIINDFEERKVDILVGTQMVTKGLDFENVSTVGIINADQMLNFPDFRAHERSYQLMSQVSGRSGRKLKRGKVIIQTQQPDHWVIQDVVAHNYEAFFQRDLFERKNFSYPPHTRLIEISLKNKDTAFLHDASFAFADRLRLQLGDRVIGPHFPLIAKVKNLWLRRILIKIEREVSTKKVKEIIKEEIQKFYTDSKNRPVQIVVDVDPM